MSLWVLGKQFSSAIFQQNANFLLSSFKTLLAFSEKLQYSRKVWKKLNLRGRFMHSGVVHIKICRIQKPLSWWHFSTFFQGFSFKFFQSFSPIFQVSHQAGHGTFSLELLKVLSEHTKKKARSIIINVCVEA